MTSKINDPAPFTSENVSAEHVPIQTTDTHPRPSTLDALERGRMRHPASDRTQRMIWLCFLIGLMALVTIGIALGLRRS